MPISAPGEPGHDPPPRASLRAKCPPVLDQDPIGSCAAFAFTNALRFLHLKDGHDERLSALFCYWASRVIAGAHPYTDSGCTAAAVVASLKKYGVCRESAWPYRPSKFAEQPPEAAFDDAASRKLVEAHRVTTLRALKRSIADGFPVPVEFAVARSVADGKDGRPSPAWKSGRFPLPSASDPSDGDHFVLAVGYDDETGLVEVENSWGKRFGKRGFGYLEYAFFGPDEDHLIADPKVPAGDAWTLRSQADDVSADPTRRGRPKKAAKA